MAKKMVKEEQDRMRRAKESVLKKQQQEEIKRQKTITEVKE